MNTKTRLMPVLWPLPKVKDERQKVFIKLKAKSTKHKADETPEIYLLKKIKQEYIIVLLSILAILLQLVITINAAIAQEKPSIGLQIGDQVPDVTITNIINYKTPTAKLSDFQDKLLILDFWDIWCGSCIAAMPKMDSLQRLFAGRIVILPVTGGKSGQIKAFWSRNPKLSGLALPSVVEDTLLHQLFPHRMVPHEVWIGPDGTVKAITSAAEIRSSTIEKMLQEGKAVLPQKQDVLDFDQSKPLLVNGNGAADSTFLYRSMIAGYLPGVPSLMGWKPADEKNTIRVYATNATILNLYALAYREILSMPANRIILQVTDPSQYTSRMPAEGREQWKQQHLYAYELLSPPLSPQQLSETIVTDLDRFFRLRGNMEKRQMKCIVLKDKGNPTPAGGKESLSAWLYRVNQTPGSVPVINESTAKGTMPVNLPPVLPGLAALKKLLEPYGLDAAEETRSLEVFVLQEQPDPS